MFLKLAVLSDFLREVGPWARLGALLLMLFIVVLLTALFLRMACALYNALARNQGQSEAQVPALGWGAMLATAFAVLVVWYATILVADSFILGYLMRATQEFRPDPKLTEFASILALPLGLFAVAVTLRIMLKTTFARGLAVASMYAVICVTCVFVVGMVIRTILSFM